MDSNICATDASKFRSAFGLISCAGIYSEKLMCSVRNSVLAEMSFFVSACCMRYYYSYVKLRNDM